jgi:hypothetical protein
MVASWIKTSGNTGFPPRSMAMGGGPPVCWQGWVFLLAWIAGLSGCGYLVLTRLHSMALFFTIEAVFVAVLIFVCVLKGEKPGWRWGDKK